MNIEIDKTSGFCFGVKNAIKSAEKTLKTKESLFCLGDIVHNGNEINRLNKIGLVTIDNKRFENLQNCQILLRAHGEPPSTYEIAKENNLKLIDSTCPVVKKLQQKIKKEFNSKENNNQIVIFGKEQHPEIISLNGQIDNKAIVISDISDFNKIDFNKPISLFSQTTMDTSKYSEIISEIKNRQAKNNDLKITNSICASVSGRESKLKEFCKTHDTIIFVGGRKSSNGKMLFGICKNANPNSFYISDIEELEKIWFLHSKSVGICGATSTPFWQLENVSKKLKNL